MERKTIIIVEDEALAGLEIQENLQKAGYHVPEVVPSSDKVLSAVVKHKPHLIIMDIKLDSYTDGIDAAQRLRILGNTPVMYLTAYGDQKTRDRADRTGHSDFLVKPVSSELLCESVARALA